LVTVFCLSSTSISAQKVVDQFSTPDLTAYNSRQYHEPRTMDRPMYGAVHADLKHLDAGIPSSFAAATHFAQTSNARRDELLQQYQGANEAQS
jgi:hypothetical protein